MSTPLTAPLDLQIQEPNVVDLRTLTSRDLDPLLLDQTAEWARRLDWDFSKFAVVVRKFADAQMLNGAALVDRNEIVGYGHTCLEDNKGLITDLYVRPAWRTVNAEVSLCRVLLNNLRAAPGVRRVESQFMLLERDTARALQRRRVRLFERLLMKLDANAPMPPGRTSTADKFRIDPWSERHHHAAAAILFEAHIGHIDTQINDQYRTSQEARRLLDNIVQFPDFYQPASYIAYDITKRSAAGLLLSSFVAEDVAQITELCVTPNARGAGLGYQLLRQSIGTLRNAGAKRISLTVTAANWDAVRLYSRCGFRTAHSFYAYVWEAR